jgi:hypothetical protein
MPPLPKQNLANVFEPSHAEPPPTRAEPFGLRWQAERIGISKSNVRPQAPSPLRSAGAVQKMGLD